MISFDGMLGQERMIRYFRKGIERDALSHAYIISGEKGMGKKTVANAFALELFCERGGACLSCHSCKQILAGTHPDVIKLRHEKPGSIGVEEVRRQLVEDAYIRPYREKYKLYIVDEAHKLTTEAQNALLKTIEEPPPYLIVLLLSCNIHTFLDTICSRCMHLALEYLDEERLARHLCEAYGCTPEKAQEIAAYAGGNIGLAQGLYTDEQLKADYEEYVQILRSIRWIKAGEVSSYVGRLKDKELSAFTDFARLWYRDILVVKSTGRTQKLVFRGEYKALSELAGAYTFMELNKILEALSAALQRSASNVNAELNLFLLLEKLRGDTV